MARRRRLLYNSRLPHHPSRAGSSAARAFLRSAVGDARHQY